MRPPRPLSDCVALLVLTGNLILLCVWGGGIFPGALCLVSGSLALTLLCTARRDAPPCPWIAMPAIGLALFVFLTTVPLPAGGGAAHTRRAAENAAARQAEQTALQLKLTRRIPVWFAAP